MMIGIGGDHLHDLILIVCLPSTSAEEDLPFTRCIHDKVDGRG